jgi:hypothetical protein
MGVGLSTCGATGVSVDGLGFGLRTSAGRPSAWPSVAWPAMPEATSIWSAGDPGGPLRSLASPVLLSA